MSEWISVKDRYPTEDQRVIYYFEFVGMHFGTYRTFVEEGYTCHQFGGRHGFLTDDVTHWMPQPLPPVLD